MEDRVTWPEGRAFAFSIFDDPDSQTFEASQAVYGFLKDCGFRTTKGVWPSRPTRTPSDYGITCGDSHEYVTWLEDLQAAGFELGLHNVTSHTSRREETLAGLQQFAAYFGRWPQSLANHYFCHESMYWGEHRVTGLNRTLYNAVTLGRKRGISYGHQEGHAYFWGDACKEKIKYVRNFVFRDINTLRACPFMPYHDPLRPYVNYWFASAAGNNVEAYLRCVTEQNLSRLEREGGACIMYVHFGHGFYEAGRLHPGFRAITEKLASRNGWFVPVTPLLDFLLARKSSSAALSDKDRSGLERRWLLQKVRSGTA
jgi:hypothetical protein